MGYRFGGQVSRRLQKYISCYETHTWALHQSDAQSIQGGAHPVQIVDVKLPSGKVATVPVFDFESSALRLLDDDNIVQSKLCKDNLDPETWKQVVPIRQPSFRDSVNVRDGMKYAATATLNLSGKTGSRLDQATMNVPVADVYTGAMVGRGIDRFVGNLTPLGVDLVRPLALGLFIDASHANLFGSIKLTPIKVFFLVYGIRERRKTLNSFLLGYLPNMAVGEGRSAGAVDIETYDT